MQNHLRLIQQRLVHRLRCLSVDVRKLSAKQSKDALDRFAATFLGATRTDAFREEIDSALESFQEVDFRRWLLVGAPLPQLRPRFGWLGDWMPSTTCIRFDRRVALPALSLPVTGMLDEWALTWPGTYVSFGTSRAIVVTLDCEVMCYDAQSLRKSPYRARPSEDDGF